MQIQVIDAGHYLDNQGFPVVTLYGITMDGKSCIKYVHGFISYFYIYSKDLKKAEIYITELTKKIGIEIEIMTVNRFKPIGYQTKPVPMLKVYVKNPKDIRILQDFCNHDGYVSYESDIIFRDRFMIDHGITGAGWVIVPKESHINHTDVIGINEKANAPMKIMTLDIEALPKEDGRFPTADEDPVILISMSFSPAWRGQTDVVMMAKDIGCLRPDVIMAKNETDMLKKLSFIVAEYDPDIVSGYNIVGFDLPYLVDRSKTLKIQLRMSRDGRPPWCKSFLGKYSATIQGRIVLDMLPAVKAIDKYRLKNYRLATVAQEILHSEKLDVKANEMRALWEGPDIKRFISYSRRDSWLVMRLIKELKVMDKYIALAKASGALLQVVVNGGQSNMIEARLAREFILEHRVMGVKQALDEDDFDEKDTITGAIVLPPVIGLTEEVLILDFKSLYPTIMMAYNLCYSTEIRDEEPPDGQVITSPSGGRFVSPHVYKGIIPRVLSKILNERIAAKKAMKQAKSPEERDALDAKQYAMKILLNSMYGYSGYTRARLFSPIIANSVTSYGRENLLRTCKIVEDIGTVDGKSLKVIAGDTDSVFISVSKHLTFEEAKETGIQIAKTITAGLPDPMELVFEAYARRILIIAKKHYAMYRFENADTGVIKAKGIETVRRDWCNLTARTLTACLEKILIEGNVDDALNHARIALTSVKEPSEDTIKDLILTRTLTRNPENYDQAQPHAELVKKMKKRGVQKYVLGDRIPFVIIKSQRKKGSRQELMTARAEDPEYAMENNIPIDTEYYVKKQLLPPLSRIFASFNISEQDLMQKSRQQSIFSW